MTIKYEETKKEREERIRSIDKEIFKTGSMLLFVAVIVLLIFIVIIVVTKANNDNKPIGNPWECADCKDIGSACKKHKDYDKNKAIAEKTEKCLMNYGYIKDKDEMQFIYAYYKNNLYNTECDFCKEQGKECEGCKYTRQSICNYIAQVLSDESIYNRMTFDCQEKGYPYCESDIQLVEKEVLKRIGVTE